MRRRSRPCQHKRRLRNGRVITVNRGRKKIVKRNYGSSFFHGTSEEALVKMPLTGGLKPSKGKLYLTDDPRYARFKGRQKGNPIIIEVEDPGDLVREGRHFVSKKEIPSRDFKKVHVRNYGFLQRSTRWRDLAEAAKDERELGKPIRNEEGKVEIIEGRLEPFQVLAFVDIDRGLRELRNKGVRIGNNQERDIKTFINKGDLKSAYEILPRPAKISLALSTNAENIVANVNKEKKTTYRR